MYLINDDRYGCPCLIEDENYQSFLDSMEESMFEFDPENSASEAEQREGWRSELEDACQSMDSVHLPDGRTGYTYEQIIRDVYRSETHNPVYVEAADGTAEYIGDLDDISD